MATTESDRQGIIADAYKQLVAASEEWNSLQGRVVGLDAIAERTADLVLNLHLRLVATTEILGVLVDERADLLDARDAAEPKA